MTIQWYCRLVSDPQDSCDIDVIVWTMFSTHTIYLTRKNSNVIDRVSHRVNDLIKILNLNRRFYQQQKNIYSTRKHSSRMCIARLQTVHPSVATTRRHSRGSSNVLVWTCSHAWCLRVVGTRYPVQWSIMHHVLWSHLTLLQPPWTEWLTDKTGNINFPQLRYRAVIRRFWTGELNKAFPSIWMMKGNLHKNVNFNHG